MDGSSRGKPGPIGIGGVLRDYNGTFLCLFSCPVDILESNSAEVVAIMKTLKLSVKLFERTGNYVSVQELKVSNFMDFQTRCSSVEIEFYH